MILMRRQNSGNPKAGDHINSERKKTIQNESAPQPNPIHTGDKVPLILETKSHMSIQPYGDLKPTPSPDITKPVVCV